jgi:hypothetical protein
VASIPGPFDIVAHGRGGLLARSLAVDGRLPLRRVCQLGTPNQGTPLANEANLPQFLDAHVAMLARTTRTVAQGTLEGVLCVARCVAQGLRAALPGLEALTPDNASACELADFSAPGLEWFTVGAEFSLPAGHVDAVCFTDGLAATPNDLVVPAQGCHAPGIPVNDSLHVFGAHHHGYFADPAVRDRLALWLL